VIVAQVSRYRRHSTPVERQQTKWVVLALVPLLLVFEVRREARSFSDKMTGMGCCIDDFLFSHQYLAPVKINLD
jgi:hypothetical protein